MSAALPKTMSAVTFAGAGGPEVIDVIERPVPEPRPGEVLIRVAAAGLNRADVLQRRGHYPPPPGASDIPGLEVSGVIVGRGPGVPQEPVYDDGAPVCALLASGGYAQYVAVPAGQVLPVPVGISLEDAAGLPEAVATVWSNIVMEGGLDITRQMERPEWVLVHGGSGGIGAAAIQIVKACGARVAVTGSSAQKLDFARELGADVVINYRQEDFVERVRAATDGRGAEVILDVVGAAYLSRNVEALAESGRLVVIGLGGGTRGELDLGMLLRKRGRVIATALRSRPLAEKAAIMEQVRRHVWPMLEQRRVRPTTDRVFALAEAAEAHAYFDSGEHRGKVLLRA